ncbi:MAG: OmpA family protein [Nitrospiraceae bacterium]|nr:MAG: OmpA family protein [Nitrospiraceae bacterium]
MRKRKEQEKEHENVDRWMVSYADFVTLLFCFFTAMYAISNVDSSKLGKFVDSMRAAFHYSTDRGNAFAVIEDVQVNLPGDIEVESGVREILGTLAGGSENSITVRRDSRGVVISIADRHFFDPSTAELSESSKKILDKIADALLRYPNMVRIEGHTDNVPVNSSFFPSNWELSSIRAVNVAKYLIGNHSIHPGRIAAVGYSEYRPMAPNDTPGGRAKNRRVEVILLNDRESFHEP